MAVEIYDLDAPKKAKEHKLIRFVKESNRDDKIGAELDTRTGNIRPVNESGAFLFRDYEDLTDDEAKSLAACLIACAEYEW